MAPRFLFPYLLAASTALLAMGCTPTTHHATADAVDGPAHPLLLVSLDGLHPDHLFQGHSPHLDALARRGARARWMVPAYPSLTFPNHYTLVTGLRPDRHGIIDNTMSDPTLGGFWLSNREAVGDGRWWDDGEPIWVTAQAHGLRTATMFWPGSEADIGGIRPDHWHPYDGGVSKSDRVAQVLEWLDLPRPRRPHLLTLYFEHIDSAAHTHGPGSDGMARAIAAVDTAIGTLLSGLAERGIADRINLIIVSDHGMAPTHPDRVLFVEDILPRGTAGIVSIGSSLGLNPREGRTAEVEAALLGRHERFECWRRGELPGRWHFGRHPRVPRILCQADTGWRFVSLERASRRPGGWQAGFNLGSHGYDPEDPSMRALFIASGPDIVAATLIEPFENIHVHPLLVRLLGLRPHDGIDGDPSVLEPIMRR